MTPTASTLLFLAVASFATVTVILIICATRAIVHGIRSRRSEP